MRQFQFRVGHDNFALIHVSLVPDLHGEQKTKPTQTTVHSLRGLGLLPDLVRPALVLYISIMNILYRLLVVFSISNLYKLQPRLKYPCSAMSLLNRCLACTTSRLYTMSLSYLNRRASLSTSENASAWMMSRYQKICWKRVYPSVSGGKT